MHRRAENWEPKAASGVDLKCVTEFKGMSLGRQRKIRRKNKSLETKIPKSLIRYYIQNNTFLWLYIGLGVEPRAFFMLGR